MAMVQLVVGGSLHVVRIRGGELVGRDRRCDVVLDSPLVSRSHFSILLEGDRFVLWDQASRNGTYVNQRRVLTRALEHGDQIIIGDVVLTFWEEPADPHNSLDNSLVSSARLPSPLVIPHQRPRPLVRFPETDAA